MAGTATPRDQLDRLLLLVKRAARYWWLVVAFLVVGGALSVGFAMLRKTRYQSEAMIVYRELIPVSALQGSSAVEDNRNLGQRVHDMMLARPRLVQVIRELRLYPDLVDETEPETGYVEAVEVFRANIRFRARGAGTFHIAFSHEDPETAQKVTARLADLLIEDDKALRLEQANVTTNFLRAESDRAEAELKVKEKELAEFLAEHPEFAQENATAGAPTTAGHAVRAAQAMRNRQRGADPRVSALERQRERLVARLRAPNEPVQVRPSGEPSAEARAALARIEGARRDVDNARRDLDRYLSQYTEKHPDVVAAKKRLADAEKRLADAEAAVPRDEPAIVLPPSNPNERAELERQLADVDRELAAARRASDDRAAAAGGATGADTENWVVALETTWQRLNREVVEARARHQQLEGRLFTAQIAASSEIEASGARMQIIDPAFRPTKPAGAPRRLIVMAGVVLFLGLGIAFAFGLALIDDRIYDRTDIEKLGIAPVLVVVPPIEKARRGRGRRAAA